MKLSELRPGDAVYAKQEICNDGSIPDLHYNAIMAIKGCRGVIVETGHLEEDPDRKVYLVRFEDNSLNLGDPTGCWPEELSAIPICASE